MPLKNGALTRKEEAFAIAYAECGDRELAEKRANMTPRHGYAVLSRPEVQARILQEQTARLVGEILPAATQAHLDIIRDKNAPAGARASLIKLAYDRAFGEGSAGAAKEVHEMTPEELAQAIEALEQVKAGLAKPIEEAQPKGDLFD